MTATTPENRLADVLARVLAENPSLVELLAQPVKKTPAKAKTPPKRQPAKSEAQKKTEKLQEKIGKATSKESKPRAKNLTTSQKRTAKQAQNVVPSRVIDTIPAWHRSGFEVGAFTIEPDSRITSIVYSSKVADYRAYLVRLPSHIEVSHLVGDNFVTETVLISRLAWSVNRVQDDSDVAILWVDEIEGNQGNYVRKFMQSL